MVSFFQLVVSIFTRFLQSSIDSAITQGDAVATAPGYLFGSLPKAKPDEEKQDVSRKSSIMSKRSSKDFQNVQYTPVPTGRI